MFKKICKRIKIICLQIKLNKSKDELIDVVLDWNKILQEKNKQLKEKVEGYEQTRDRLIEMGFPTFMSCREYTEQLEKLQEDLKHKKIAIQNRKARIKKLEKQIEKMKCCENCKGVCNSDDVAHFCKNNDYKLWEIRK